MNGGQLIAEVLKNQGIEHLFVLSGGHIAPIFVEAKRAGIRIIDVRDEKNAVFAADATARLTGKPGVAAVTAGPGVTNTITALKNAQMAQSPVILLGGAPATLLKGRGALQDIDQISLLRSTVKWAKSVSRVRDIVPVLEKAFHIAQNGVPGPVFIELPIDLLYEESLVRQWAELTGKPKDLKGRLKNWYINNRLNGVYKAKDSNLPSTRIILPEIPTHSSNQIRHLTRYIEKSRKPVLLIGSQAMLDPRKVDDLITSIEAIGAPVYLSGMARGLLGQDHPLHMKHKRRFALSQADFVLLAGVPSDFRLGYGNHIKGHSKFISVNRDQKDLMKNKKPDYPILSDPANLLIDLGKQIKNRMNARFDKWKNELGEMQLQREMEIDNQATEEIEGINPVHLFRVLNSMIDQNSILVADGGDFVATAAYTLQPRGPLRWLDPGVFGTLGVGGGFALGSKLVHPDAEVWIIWGDGSSAYSLAEFDTFTRLGIPVIGLIGNDAGWTQISRDQIELLGDDVASVLAYSNYDVVAEGYGGKGKRVETIEEFVDAVREAKLAVQSGHSFLINAIIGKTDFRKGSISM